jgi:hypothetical protein
VNTATVAGNSSGGGRTRTCPSPSFDARSLKAGKVTFHDDIELPGYKSSWAL